jgi:hypothetical protein
MHLYNDASYRNELAVRAKQFVNSNQGATDRIAKLISNQLNDVS